VRFKNFKQFESTFDFPSFKQNVNFLSEDDIKDIFTELLDDGFTIEFFDTSQSSLYFNLKKIYDENAFDPIELGSAYGISNLSRINDEMKILPIVEVAKERMNSTNYEIGFEFEFHFGLSPMVYIACHAQHRDYIPKD